VVYQDDHVVFRQLDEHTWIGNGHLVYNESLYLVEGNERALLIDAGTYIPDLDKIVAKDRGHLYARSYCRKYDFL
jgi:hypothetical protein